MVVSPAPVMADLRLLLRPGLQGALVALAAFAVFSGALANGFVYDDVVLVLENPWVRSAGGVLEGFGRPLFGFHESSTAEDARSGYYRPLVHALFYVQRWVFGPVPWAHHLLLVLAHVVASVLVLGLLRAVLGRGREASDGAGAWAALGGALLFALHPVHTEAVAWVSGWMDVGTALAVLVAVRLWGPAPASSGRALAAAGVWLCGLLIKETAIVLPVLLWAAERASGGDVGGVRARVRRYGLLALALLPYAVLRLRALGLALPSGGRAAEGTFRGLDVLALMAELGGKLFWPVPLTVVPPSGPVTSPWEPRVWVGAVLVLALVGLLALALRRKHAALLAGVIWLGVPLLPAFYLQLRGVEAYAERYLYLPSVGFVLLVGLALRGVLERWPGQARAVGLAFGGTLAAAALLTGVAVRVWEDDLTLWEHTLREVPDRPLVHASLGNALLKARRVEEAVPHLEVAAAALPEAFRVQSDLAVAYAQTGRLDEAVRVLERAVRLRPDFPVVWHNLGLALRRLERLDEAEAHFRQALRLAPGRAESHLELGRTLLRRGHTREAVTHLREALRLQPGLEAARRALASVEHAPPPQGP